MQTGYRYAYENGFDLAVRLDGDGQHDPRELPLLLAPVLAGEADIAVGSRFAGTRRASARRGRAARRSASSPGRCRRSSGSASPTRPRASRSLNRARDRALRRRLPARLPRGGGDGAARQARAAPGRGARDDARAREPAARRSARCARSTTWSRSARGLRRGVPPGRGRCTDRDAASVCDRRRDRVRPPRPRRPRADPQAAPARALRAALAARPGSSCSSSRPGAAG